ncbi:hypothetical protein JCM18382A_50920 [Bradyrhizobium sp. 17-4]
MRERRRVGLLPLLGAGGAREAEDQHGKSEADDDASEHAAKTRDAFRGKWYRSRTGASGAVFNSLRASAPSSTVFARLDRAIQYSRDGGD